MRFQRTTTLALVGCIALFGCKKKEERRPRPPRPRPRCRSRRPRRSKPPLRSRSASVDVGKAIGPDKKISDPATTFGPKDTIYASVATEGAAPTVKLHAKWTFGDAGTVVKEEDLSISPTGPAVNEFHISKKTPWPVGKYKVEITADGNPAGSKDFEIKK